MILSVYFRMFEFATGSYHTEVSLEVSKHFVAKKSVVEYITVVSKLLEANCCVRREILDNRNGS